MSDETPNPRKQECKGKYLYGSGYFAREDQRLGILRGKRTDATFCNECPVVKQCERQHGIRVRALLPEDAETFERQVKEAERKGMTRALAAVARMKSGDPDPYMALALENYRDGVRAREAIDKR